MKKTFALSVLLHGILVSALLLLGGDGGSMPGETVVLARLVSGPETREQKEPFDHTGKDDPEKTPVESRRQDPAPGEQRRRRAEAEALLSHAVLRERMSDVRVTVTERIEGEHGPAEGLTLEASHGAGTIEESAHEMTVRADSRMQEGGAVIVQEERSGPAASGILERIGRAIEKVKSYPPLARRRGIEGTVHVGFSINPEGEPEDITVVRSSGHTVLDAATLHVVQKAAPYPYTESLIEVPVTYQLKGRRP